MQPIKLDDTSRKVLRILYNLYGFHEFQIDIYLLSRYSMRDVKRIKEAINTLVLKQFLIWKKEQNIYKVTELISLI